MNWYALTVFLMGVVIGGAWVYGGTRVRRMEQNADAISAVVLRAAKQADTGDSIVVTYPGFLTSEQRQAVRDLVAGATDGWVRTVILEGGLRAKMLRKHNENPT